MTIILDGQEVQCAEFAPVPGVWVANKYGVCLPVFSVMLTGLECAYVLVAARTSREFSSIPDESQFSFVTGPDDRLVAARRRRAAGEQLALELDGRGA